MKPSRRRKGATLGLVASCVLVIIVLGMGVFFLAKLFGGGREVANATDAGTLSIAKNALVQPAVQLPAFTQGSVVHFSEFYGCAYPNPIAANPSNPSAPAVINLFTYNRCVGQALLIALNAKEESDASGSNVPLQNAQIVLNDLNALGQTLKNGMQGSSTIAPGGAGSLKFDPNNLPPTLGNNFTKNANSSNVAMFNSTSNTAAVQGATSYKTAWMKPGGATNVYMVTPTQPATPPVVTTSTNTPDPLNLVQGLSKKFYLQGYVPITVAGIGPFYGVPVLPQQKPHLVSNDDFIASGTDMYAGVVPPNSFQVNASAQQNGGNFGGAVSCAIVGAVFQNTGAGATSPDFPVAIPSGYVELLNQPGNTNLPAGFLPTDNSTNIFNNELFNGAGGGLPGTAGPQPGNYGSGDLYTANASVGGSVFGELAALQAWSNYNALPVANPSNVSPTNNPSGKNLNFTTPATPYPPTVGFPSGLNQYLIFDATGQPASQTICLSISGTPLDCTTQNDTTGGLTGNCLNDLNGFTAAYQHGLPTVAVAGGAPPGGVSAVDTIKGEILANFNGAGYHKQITVGTVGTGTNTQVTSTVTGNMSGYTGLGEYMSPLGEKGTFATPQPASEMHDWNSFPIQNTGSTNVTSGAHASILGLLAQLDGGNGTAASGVAGLSPNNNYFPPAGTSTTGCNPIFQALLQRVQQIQPAATQADLEGLLNGQVENATGKQYSLEMGQTAYIFLNSGDLSNTTGLPFHGLRIYAETTGTPPKAVISWTKQNPDGMPTTTPSTVNGVPTISPPPTGATSCGQTYSLYNSGSGLVDVRIQDAATTKGDDALHEQPYESGAQMIIPNTLGANNPDYGAQDKGTWVAGSGYGNILGRLYFSDVVSGTANFSSPN